MKRYQSASKAVVRKNKKDNDVVKRAIIKISASAVLFVLLTVICKMPFAPCRKIKNEIVYFLNYTYDFKAAAYTAYEWFNEYVISPDVAPALSESQEITDDNNTVVIENGD